MKYALIAALWLSMIPAGKWTAAAIKTEQETIAYVRYKAKCVFDGEKFECGKPVKVGEG